MHLSQCLWIPNDSESTSHSELLGVWNTGEMCLWKLHRPHSINLEWRAGPKESPPTADAPSLAAVSFDGAYLFTTCVVGITEDGNGGNGLNSQIIAWDVEDRALLQSYSVNLPGPIDSLIVLSCSSQQVVR